VLKVLVVEDQPAVCTALELLFELHGLPALVAHDPEKALELIASEDIGAVVQDMNFRRDATDGEEGTRLLRATKKLDPDLPVLIMTAFTSLEAAVQLIKEGASDYIAKPWDDDKLVTTVKNLVRLRELSQENTRLRAQGSRARQELAETYDICGLVYASPQMHEVVSLAVKVARSDAAILVSGPNGAGKERLAQIVQANSRRRDKPFVQVNAGGLPDELLEAELFGAEAGAYTGAKKLRIGRFEEADGGTLFLDEIGNLSTNGQVKLLRVLQTGEFQRLGSNTTRKTDVRLISATNANLAEAIRQGTFREDLYFRLNVIELSVPALRDRPDDIEPLAEFLLKKHASADNRGELTIGRDARQAMLDYEWPGNVRELDNRIQRAVLVAKSNTITAVDLGLAAGPEGYVRSSDSAPPVNVPVVHDSLPGDRASGNDASERAQIEHVLTEARGVVSKAAAQLGVSRQALYRRMERLGIELERRPKA
jgi:DNA-binding NtrC family response regulator